MSNKYRVTMTDSVNGETFTFAVHYMTPNASWAESLAINEWGNLPIIDVKRVE